MHATERERAILELLQVRGFISFRELATQVDASAATLRRDLERMDSEGRVKRIRGGVEGVDRKAGGNAEYTHLLGTPFLENISLHRKQKERIGRAAAALCPPGSAVMIDGGSTTLQMCRHFEGKALQVLTNSLHIVNALLPQSGTRVWVPGGCVFREQNIILAAAGDEAMPRFHAPRLFMGAAAVGAQGVMQADVILVAAERRLIERAKEVILLVDSSKFQGSGNVVCDLEEVDVVVTDRGIARRDKAMLKAAGIDVIIAD
jgi:DeoR family transcriptional regulator, ulaG and ulaABCDEF operon transcriptional repressor